MQVEELREATGAGWALTVELLDQLAASLAAEEQRADDGAYTKSWQVSSKQNPAFLGRADDRCFFQENTASRDRPFYDSCCKLLINHFAFLTVFPGAAHAMIHTSETTHL